MELKEIISKFNKDFDEQIFIDWFKSQIKEAFNQGYREAEIDGDNSVNDVSLFEDADNYYNDKFKND